MTTILEILTLRLVYWHGWQLNFCPGGKSSDSICSGSSSTVGPHYPKPFVWEARGPPCLVLMKRLMIFRRICHCHMLDCVHGMVEDVSSKFMETLGQGGRPRLELNTCFCMPDDALLPFLYLLKVPDPAMYLHYTPGSREIYGRELEAFYHVVMAHPCLALFSVAFFFLMHARRFFYSLLFIAPFAWRLLVEW